MKFFETKKQDAYTVIIGCGRLGANLANTLSNEGENVLIILPSGEYLPTLAVSLLWVTERILINCGRQK